MATEHQRIDPTVAVPDSVWRRDRPPVEHRAFGLDRRSFKFAVPVILIAIFWIFVIPGLNSALDYDQTIEAGDELIVAPGVTFTPSPGWSLEEGLLVSEKTRSAARGGPVLITNGAISMSVFPGQFEGTPSELIKQIDKESVSFSGHEAFAISGEKASFPVEGAEENAVIESYTAPDSEGVIGAYVFDQTGLKVSAAGPAQAMSEHAEEIGEMLASFRYVAPDEKGSK